MSDINRFANLSFADFAKMAQNDSLSRHEKIGFPDSYRKGKEQSIFNDIISKITSKKLIRDGVMLDIGPGCSKLPQMMTDLCVENNCKLLLVDSKEMLALIPDKEYMIEKYNGCFPDVPELITAYQEKINFILCYSVFHYVFEAGNFWEFIDESLGLLAEGGVFIIGDIPNVSMRKRFFSSNSGIKFHQQYTESLEVPEVEFNTIEKNKIDDSIILSILQRARLQGFDAYVVPQAPDLPMANRREDIIIKRP